MIEPVYIRDVSRFYPGAGNQNIFSFGEGIGASMVKQKRMGSMSIIEGQYSLARIRFWQEKTGDGSWLDFDIDHGNTYEFLTIEQVGEQLEKWQAGEINPEEWGN